jgi:hypothetical protein
LSEHAAVSRKGDFAGLIRNQFILFAAPSTVWNLTWFWIQLIDLECNGGIANATKASRLTLLLGKFGAKGFDF